MDDAFHDGLEPERLKQLMARDDGPGRTKILLQTFAVVASGALLLVCEGLLLWPALLLHGAAQVGFFGALHESAHGTAFASRGWNRGVSWLASTTQFMAPELFRAFHFAHHRHTHDLEQDPELAGMPFMAEWPKGAMILAHYSGLPILMARVGWTVFAASNPPRSAWESVLPFVSERKQADVARDSQILLAMHLALVCLASVEPQLWRLDAGAWVGHALLSAYITGEHRGLPMEGLTVDRTRSFPGTAAVDWHFWGMPYHAEHHAYPAVPFFALPALSEAMGEQVRHRFAGFVDLQRRRGREA
jgi:fatty acid desaturase